VTARLVALLLALAVIAGVASPNLAAAFDAVSQLDDGRADTEPAIASPPVAMVLPARRELAPIAVPPRSPDGRLHAAWVFRPPR
jgi:hypothetical protein